jgi:uncharacterized protein YutD
MKAVSVVWELSILLEDEEVVRLGNEKLVGKIMARDREVKIGDKDLEIMVGEINPSQAFAELLTEPAHVYIDSVERYKVILSDEGYSQLKRIGYICDRMINGFTKVDLMSLTYYNKEVRMFEM